VGWSVNPDWRMVGSPPTDEEGRMFFEDTLPAIADPPTDARPAARLLELVRGYASSQLTATMARLDLADQFDERLLSSGELARACGADRAALLRFLRAAASIGLLEEIEPDRFALTPVGACLRKRADGSSLREVAIGLTAPSLTRPLERLTDAVRSGQPTTECVLGTNLWQYLAAHPEEGRDFARAMTTFSASAGNQVVAQYDVSRCERIVDVGGGQGAMLARLLAEAPDAHGVLFDRPEVVAGARATFARHGLAERVELVGGDFLEAVPDGGDLYVLRTVLHNWDDTHATHILANCYRAARAESNLLVMEALLPERAEAADAFVFTLDVAALAIFGGRERTRQEFERLLVDAGYQVERVTDARASSLPWSLLVARRDAK
jgi:ubiquinone/menaquinone biosynthesis C-methylase UbiE